MFLMKFNICKSQTTHKNWDVEPQKNMKKLFFLAFITFFSMIVNGQFSIVAGDTSQLSHHYCFNPPEHIERIGMGDPIEYDLDVDLDGFDDISIKCANSFGALGYASNYFTVKAIDSNEICYAYFDSSYCFNGYKPVYFAKLFSINDTIKNELAYGKNEIIISKELWFMKDTCTFNYADIGAKYLAVRLNSHGIRGLAWVSIELFAKNSNGFSADLIETGFKSVTSSIPENVLPALLVYPIPSNGFVNIITPEWNGPITATIFDMSGNEILVKKLNAKKTGINLVNGIYVLIVSDKNKNLLTRKIIFQ